MAHVFGAASQRTNTITTLKNVAIAIPIAPNNRSATMPVRVACTSWHTNTTSSTGLRNRSGWVTSPSSLWPPVRLSSVRACAFDFVMRVSAVSAMAR